ncbi:hypothetical protein B0H14DRAFT_3171330 [Mycena olivaceomarginata]|nr:hypothetical protein B0H14DRAFT_3171330 [Mycena olivaceomarginata]
MDSLPLELLQTITEDIRHDPSIFTLRLVSKTLNSAATPLAFRTVVVNDCFKSAEAVSFLQDCDDSITSLVHRVLFRGDSAVKRDGGDALISVFSRLSRLPNLKRLRLDFHRYFEEEDTFRIPGNPTRYLLLQHAIFRALGANPFPSSLISLTLHNVLSIPDDIYLDAAFHRVFAPLHSLDISVLSNVEDEGAYFQDPLVSFWNDSMAAIVRSATALTKLTIRSDHPVGAYPALSFRDTFLPYLASLTLDVVAFILRHKGTLARLALHGCSIDGGEDGVFLRPWHAVLALFEAELDGLRNFLFVNDDAARESEFERDARFVYTRLDPGWGYMPWNEELATEGLDLPALESLQAVVKSRRLGAD